MFLSRCVFTPSKRCGYIRHEFKTLHPHPTTTELAFKAGARRITFLAPSEPIAIGFVAPQEMLAGRQPQISPHRPQARRPTLSSANSAASRMIKNHSSNHDARYNDFAR
jgi:hypothetical protein